MRAAMTLLNVLHPDAPNHTDDGARVSRRLPGAVVDGGSLVHSADRQLVATLPQLSIDLRLNLEGRWWAVES